MEWKPIATGIILFVCALALVAALTNLHCTAVRAGDATLVVACSASRLEAAR